MTEIYIPIALRKAVIERAGGRCEYCQLPSYYSPVVFEIEHIRPVSAGGTTSLSNLALSCPACNRYKGDRQSGIDPETGHDVPLFNPRSQQWEHHFEWRDDFTLIVGITATGRATVTTLRMNRPAVRRFRIALRAIGQYPGLINDEGNDCEKFIGQRRRTGIRAGSERYHQGEPGISPYSKGAATPGKPVME